mgnify:FL=1
MKVSSVIGALTLDNDKDARVDRVANQNTEEWLHEYTTGIPVIPNESNEFTRSSTKKVRTLSQNNAMHLYCELLAAAMNDAGYDMSHPVFEKVSSEWTMYSVKEKLFKRILKTIKGRESTAEASTVDYDRVHRSLDYWTSIHLGISINFPDRYGSNYAEIEKQSPGTFSATRQDERG